MGYPWEKSYLLHHVCATCLLKCKKLEHHHEKTSECPSFNKDGLVETDFCLLELPLFPYSTELSASRCQFNPPPINGAAVAAEVASTLQHASSVDEISQYYVFAEAHDQLDVIVCDVPESTLPQDPELPLSAKSSLLQTIFSFWASRKPNYLCARVPVPIHWDVDLLGSLLEDYEDKLVVDFLRYSWPMSRSILPLTDGSAKVNHKGALEFPDAINYYLATEHSNNTLLGPFFTNPIPDRTASSPLNSMPKRDSDEH